MIQFIDPATQAVNANVWTVLIELVKVLGILITGIVAIWTLKVTRTVHTLTNSGMTDVKVELARVQDALAKSRENEATSAARAGLTQPVSAAPQPLITAAAAAAAVVPVAAPAFIPPPLAPPAARPADVDYEPTP